MLFRCPFILLLGCFCFLLTKLNAQDNYYYNVGQKVFFEKGDPQVARIGSANIFASDLDRLLQETGIVRPDSYMAQEGQSRQLEVRLFPPNTADDLWRLLWHDERIEYVAGLYYHLNSQDPFYFTRQIEVRLKEEASVDRFQRLLRYYGLNISREYRRDPRKLLLVAGKPDVDIVTTANRLYEKGLFEYCYPEMLVRIHFY
ncbi:hypothetical protein [Mangrovibacterium lignilyticum]|uniref:hypothetical protein n=1 Tax=Mangrovibacterium lignilyticum TaxID=2668052 RepID=UPI0013D1417E|nr:hypothetical protein [Mangrovibacterium lignilyticum]